MSETKDLEKGVEVTHTSRVEGYEECCVKCDEHAETTHSLKYRRGLSSTKFYRQFIHGQTDAVLLALTIHISQGVTAAMAKI